MKKVRFAVFVFAAVLISGTGCVKDKGFENNEYGINDPDNSPQGIGFIGGVALVSPVGLDVSSEAQSITTPLTISLLSGTKSESAVQVRVVIDNDIVNNYNTTNGTSFVTLDASTFVLANPDITIPAGAKSAFAQLDFPNTLALDPNTTYAVGVRIVSADAGYTIAQNQDELLLKIAIKNAYDGKYDLYGQFFHPTAAPGFPTFKIRVEMWTTGPNSVQMYSPNYDDFLHPWTAVTNGALTAFGLQSPEYTVDPVTNAVTVQNVYPGAVTTYSMGLGYDNAGYDSRWDPASKTMYVNFGYNLGPNGEFLPASTRAWIDTLVYTGPR